MPDVVGPENNVEHNTINMDMDTDAETDTDMDIGDKEYARKARLLNAAIQEIGMGRYQWRLFVVVGFGYFSDNAWPIVTDLILPAVLPELQFNGPFLKLGQNIGLLVGAAFWGVGADIWGRKVSFTLTMLITGTFALAAVFAREYVALTALAAAWSVGVGGNLPVDSAIFLEFLPGTHQYLLTVLSIWWALGQLITSLIAWPLLSNFSCPAPPAHAPGPCRPAENRGWRYLLLTLSLITLLFAVVRIFVFELHESPKYLMGRGREEECVGVLRRVAEVNGRGERGCVGVRDLNRVNGGDGEGGEEGEGRVGDVEGKGRRGDPEKEVEVDIEAGANKEASGTSTSARADTSRTNNRYGIRSAFRRNLAVLDANHVAPLFATRRLACSTGLLVLLWALIGLAFPLYNSFVTYYLSTRGATFGDGSTYITYRNQVILSVIGVPGALLAGYMVELPFLGRRGTLSLFTLLTGTFILLSLTSRSSRALLAWNCAYSFTSNVMYGVLYALTPELFPTRGRGTGNALCSGANRVFGVMAPVIALYANIKTSVPIFIAGGIFIVAGLIALALPYESRGKAAL